LLFLYTSDADGDASTILNIKDNVWLGCCTSSFAWTFA